MKFKGKMEVLQLWRVHGVLSFLEEICFKNTEPKISYLRGKPPAYYGNFSFGPDCLTEAPATSGREYNPKRFKLTRVAFKR